MDRPPQNEEVENAGEDYRAVRDERMALANKEREAKKELLAKMKAHNISSYFYEDTDGVERKITIDLKENVKVSKVKKTDPDDPPED